MVADRDRVHSRLAALCAALPHEWLKQCRSSKPGAVEAAAAAVLPMIVSRIGRRRAVPPSAGPGVIGLPAPLTKLTVKSSTQLQLGPTVETIFVCVLARSAATGLHTLFGVNAVQIKSIQGRGPDIALRGGFRLPENHDISSYQGLSSQLNYIPIVYNMCINTSTLVNFPFVVHNSPRVPLQCPIQVFTHQ